MEVSLQGQIRSGAKGLLGQRMNIGELFFNYILFFKSRTAIQINIAEYIILMTAVSDYWVLDSF